MVNTFSKVGIYLDLTSFITLRINGIFNFQFCFLINNNYRVVETSNVYWIGIVLTYISIFFKRVTILKMFRRFSII